MNSLLKYLLVLIAVSLFTTVNGQAQSAQSSPDTTFITGHTKKDENVIKEAKDVVVASFTVLGFPSSDASGENFYEQAEVEVINALRGALSGKLRVGYSVRTVLGKDQENLPVLELIAKVS